MYETQGKSYILNQLLGQSSGFVVAPTHRPCTKVRERSQHLYLHFTLRPHWLHPDHSCCTGPVDVVIASRALQPRRLQVPPSVFCYLLFDDRLVAKQHLQAALLLFKGAATCGLQASMGQTAQCPCHNAVCCSRNPRVHGPGALLSGLTLRQVLLDTEGIDAYDQTGQYSTQIFSLAVLLSSLFVYNQMGGIDEAALDRLSLVTEVTKHVRVRAGSAAGAPPPLCRPYLLPELCTSVGLCDISSGTQVRRS